MDFSKIKTFTIPEGKVVSLSIDGVIVWQGGLKASTLSITDGVLTITNTDDRVEKFVVISNTKTVLVLNADGTVAEEISFTINGTEYKALSGMTWGEWIESEYNTSGYYLKGTEGIPTGYYIEDAKSDDVIENGGVYTATYYTHGGGSQ
jgi:hypothetical protein